MPGPAFRVWGLGFEGGKALAGGRVCSPAADCVGAAYLQFRLPAGGAPGHSVQHAQLLRTEPSFSKVLESMLGGPVAAAVIRSGKSGRCRAGGQQDVLGRHIVDSGFRGPLRLCELAPQASMQPYDCE